MQRNTNGRDNRGRFAPGNPGGPGRPPLETERQYGEALTAACSVDDWREISERAVKDAKAGDHRAREWLCKYIVGEPRADMVHTHVHQDNGPGKYDDVPIELILKAKAAMEEVRLYTPKQ